MKINEKHNTVAAPPDVYLADFRQLYLAYFPKVKRFINYLVKSDSTSEDLTQDIFERLWLEREKCFSFEHLNLYMFRMAKNHALNYLSHKTVEDDYSSSIHLSLEYTIEEELHAKELEVFIQLIIEKMPKQQRRVYEMSRVKHLDNATIANNLQISKRTVETHISHAIKQIKISLSLSP